METDDKKYAELKEIGRCAYESIAEMVAALECDYERLAELREERADLVTALTDVEAEFTDGTAERESVNEAQDALTQWDADNGEELSDLIKAAGDCESTDDATQRIQEDALSVEVRSDWYCPSGDYGDTTPTEYKILLSTGGPATRIIGDLDRGQPTRARLQVQDWFTPWTDYIEPDTGSTLLTYAQQFYFGE